MFKMSQRNKTKKIVGTGAAPAANTTTIGAIYITYTAE